MNFLEQSGMKVISGGQAGVDIAALRAAQCLGFPTGGWAPKGFRTQLGPKPTLGAGFGLRESHGGYWARTWQNVAAANATIIIAHDANSPGTKCAVMACIEHDTPYRLVEVKRHEGTYLVPQADADQNLVAWITAQCERSVSERGCFTLNVGGNSSTTAPGIFEPAFLFMVSLLTNLYVNGSQVVEPALMQRAYKLNDPSIAKALADSYDRYIDLEPRRRQPVQFEAPTDVQV